MWQNACKFSYDFIDTYTFLLIRNILTQISKGKHMNVQQLHKLLT